jgi:hypothetical protein
MENKLNRQGLLNYGQTFSDTVMSNFFQQNERVAGKQILDFTPIRQVNLMLIKNLYEKWQSETLRLQSPYFDYSNENVQTALRNFMNTLSQHISVKESDFKPLLEQSVHESLLLALSPADFFESEVNRIGEQKLSPQRIKDLGKYIQFNKHLLDGVLGEIESFHVKQVAAGELVKALHKHAAAMQSQLMTIPEVVQMFGSVAKLTENDLLAPEPPPAPVVVPPPAAPQAPANFFDAEFLADAPVVSAPNPAAFAPAPQPVATAPVYAATTTLPEPPPLPQIPVIPPPASFTAPEPPQRIADLTLSDEKPLLETFVKEQPNINDIIRTQETDVSSVLDKIQKQKVESLTNVFPVHERFMYVNDLFGGDYVVWSEALHSLNEAPDLAHARHILSNLAQRFGWRVNSERVKAFSEIVERRF